MITADELFEGFMAYTKAWKELDQQLNRTPMWRFIRWHRILNKMRRLTRAYEQKYLRGGVQ